MRTIMAKCVQFHNETSALKVIKYSKDFVVVNKPPLLQMSHSPVDYTRSKEIIGTLPSTVEDMLKDWISEMQATDHWNGVDQPSVKWVHQLDFATSGVLCIALNRQSICLSKDP